MNDDHEKSDDRGEGERAFGEFGRSVSGFHLIFSPLNAIAFDRATIKSDRFLQCAIKRACDKMAWRLQGIDFTR
jgi:hypothetical protein